MKYFLILISSLILVSGCSSVRISQPSRKTYIETMMKLDKCTNACWLGIEAGMKIEPPKALAILGDYYGSKNVYSPQLGPNVGWTTYDEKLSPLFLEKGYIEFTDESQVNLISIIFQNNQIPITDLVETLGKPEITIIRNKNEEAVFPPCGLWQLAYPQIGLYVIVDSIQGVNYVGVMYVSEPYPVSKIQISKERELATKESIINWDERDRYCTHATPSSP